MRSLSVSSSSNAIVSGGGDELVVWNVHSLRPVVTLSDDSMKDIISVTFVVGDNHILAANKVCYIFFVKIIVKYRPELSSSGN